MNSTTLHGRVSKWLERKFDFPVPIELYPNVCARLRGTAARLEELIQNSCGEVLVRKPEGKWSAQEHAGHLQDVEPLTLVRINDFIGYASEPTKADFTNRITDEANYNARQVSDILSRFRRARLSTLDSLDKAEPGAFQHKLFHPRLKEEILLLDYLYLVAEHDDHHLASIWYLISLDS
jgi:DinB superfamily